MRPNQSLRKKTKRNRRNVRNQRQRNSSLISNSSTEFSNFLNHIEIGLHNHEEWARNLFDENQARHSSRHMTRRNRRNVRNQRQRNSSLISNSTMDFSNFLNHIEIGLDNDEEWALNLFDENQARHSSRHMTRHRRWCRCRNRAHLAHGRTIRPNTRRHNGRRQREQRQQQCRHHTSRPTKGQREKVFNLNAGINSRCSPAHRIEISVDKHPLNTALAEEESTAEKKENPCGFFHTNIQHNAKTVTEVEIFRDLMELENLKSEAEIETISLRREENNINKISSSSSIDSIKEFDNRISQTSSSTIISNHEVQTSEEDVSMIIEISDSPRREFRNEGPNVLNDQLRGEAQVEILEEVPEYRNETLNAVDTITDDVNACGDGFHNDPYYQLELIVIDNDLQEAAVVIGTPEEILEEIDNENDDNSEESDSNISDSNDDEI